MDSENFVMPILAFVIGIFSLFTNLKNKKKRWLSYILIVFLLSACIFDVVFKTNNNRRSEEELSWSKDRIKELITILSTFRQETNTTLSNLSKLLISYGWAAEKLNEGTIENIQQSLLANNERNNLTSSQDNLRRNKITIQYFPKDVDKDRVEIALKELGFRLAEGSTRVPNIATNAIWFGTNVKTEDVKLVAYTLIRAGIRIKIIRPFRNPHGYRASLVQVGADAVYVNSKSLTVEQIKLINRFVREE